jgi:hypothetical protein
MIARTLKAIILTTFASLSFLTVASLIKDSHAADENASINTSAPTLELRVDTKNRARALCNNLPALVSLGGFFEFYERGPFGGRKRIFSGPWQGYLKENFSGTFTLKGNDPESGAGYTIVFKQSDLTTIELFMTYQAPSRPSNLGFDIVKLSADLFKGAMIDAQPSTVGDFKSIPIQPLPVARRMLLQGKNRIIIKSTLCDLEIIDRTESGTMLAADFRNIPWDKEKSIFFGAEKSNLVPGKSYSFRYSIRCLPPTRAAHLQKTTISGNPVKEMNAWSFYAIPPKEERKESGHFALRPQDGIYGLPSGAVEVILNREIEKLTSLRLPIESSDIGKDGRGIFIERISPEAVPGLPTEGFEIITSQERVIVRGVSERACLYGAYAVLSRLKHEAAGWTLSCGTIRDWPDLPVRGVCIELLIPPLRDVNIVKRYLDAISRARSNVVIFLHNPPQIRAWLRNRDDGGWTRRQIAEIAHHAHSLQMEVWGGMGSSFTPADFRELEISSGTNLYNPFKDWSYKYIFSLYEEILQTYHPATLLIGHDEIQGLSVYAAQSGNTPADILAADVGRIHVWLTGKGVRTAMWGDMLLDFNEWDGKVGAANSMNAYFRSGATHQALKKLPKDVVILDWHYFEKSDYESIKYFRSNGFGAIGSPWYDPKGAQSFARSVKRYGGQGILTTDWGFLNTLTPSATTLYGPICAWSTDCAVDDRNADVAALAETMRDGVYDSVPAKQIEISLAEHANTSLHTTLQGNRRGFFEIGPVLDLRALSPGKHVLGKVSFDIVPDEAGRKKNCIVVTSIKEVQSVLPKEGVVFNSNMEAKAIAFLHTGFVEEPQFYPRKIGKYIVEYANGKTETIDLTENWNITDIRSTEGLRLNDWTFFRSPDELIGAKTGWRGNSAAGIPLNVQVFIWKNPDPTQNIRKIRLRAAEPPMKSSIALLGLTFLQ